MLLIWGNILTSKDVLFYLNHQQHQSIHNMYTLVQLVI